MLYNPQWTKQTPSLAGFIAWLETKDPNERYNWDQPAICACGQYAASIGKKGWPVFEEPWRTLNHLACNAIMSRPEPSQVRRYAMLDQSGWTFGALLQRARVAL
jgi:hypothetical protein